MNKVAIQKQSDYRLAEIREKIESSIDSLGGFGSFFRKGSRVLLKPNVLGGFASETCTTTNPVFLQAVIQYFQEHGCKVFVGDSPALAGLVPALKSCGMYESIKNTGAEIVEFKTSVAMPVSEEFKFKRIELAKEVLEFDHIVNLPKLKTHGMMLMTLAVKNLFGCIVGKRKAQWHLQSGKDYAAFAEMLVEVALMVSPTLNIVDGIWGMEGMGPSAGTPIHTGIIVAGANPAAVDVAICNVIGLNPDRLLTNKAAVTYKMIEDYGDVDYTILTPMNVRVSQFDLPNTGFMEGYGLTGGDSDGIVARLRTGMLTSMFRMAEGLMATKPFVQHEKCTLCHFCGNICPPGIIAEENKKIVIDYDKCIRCYCCHEVCPEHAMEIRDSFLKRYLGIG